ncbi:MAG: CapA family protein [Lachnospiraceae bacterium]|nr:CapA family protein [Lachnospiraceae bacterium]
MLGKIIMDNRETRSSENRRSRPSQNPGRNAGRRRRARQKAIARFVILCLLLLAVVVLLVTCVRRHKSVKEAELKAQQEAKQKVKEEEVYPITLRFAGDINFDDEYFPMQHFQEIGAESISEVIDPEYVELMNKADVMWVNNEFCYTDSGEPLAGKAFTFSANPENVKYLKELGVDVAGLANNHVFDYGEQGLLDTLATLEAAQIPYVGAGHNINEAASPVYVKAGPLTIAYVAAERAEKVQIVTQEATEDQPGVLRCYENDRFIESIREAAGKADYVIALPHWGTEHATELEDVQKDGARAYIDAGADAVIGAHPHILQGIEYYNGKPIVYSLGNFWFDNYELYTMVAELRLSKDESVELIIYPGIQRNAETHPANESERDEIFRHLEDVSPQEIQIDEQGVVSGS